MQPIRDDSDFRVLMGPSLGEFGACGAADYPAALEFGSFVTPAASAKAEKIEDPPQSRSGYGSARHEPPFNLLEPETGVARPLVDLDPRHAFVA